MSVKNEGVAALMEITLLKAGKMEVVDDVGGRVMVRWGGISYGEICCLF